MEFYFGVLLVKEYSNFKKKILRVISLNKYNAHTDPIFKNLNILKLNDIFVLNQLKFYHKLVNKKRTGILKQFTTNRK